MSQPQQIRPKVVLAPAQEPAAGVTFLRWLIEAARESGTKKKQEAA